MSAPLIFFVSGYSLIVLAIKVISVKRVIYIKSIIPYSEYNFRHYWQILNLYLLLNINSVLQ